MDWDDFAKHAHEIADWGAKYHRTLRDRPVRAQVSPGEVAAQLAITPPETGEAMEQILSDFDEIVLPGMTHWQHPRFFAYFPANAAPPSILAEYLVSTLAAQCMLWQTSPAATEMETRMVDWLRQAFGLPEGFSGTLQDSASTATFAAVLMMRERALNWQGNTQGLKPHKQLRIYCSCEVHTSVDRAIWMSGIGADNLVRIPSTGPQRSMDAKALRQAIEEDIAAGHHPAGVIACIGATGVGSCDDLQAVMSVAKDFDLFTHVDAAWAGAAMIVPEFRQLWNGIEAADSLVINPHKWLGAQFDCSAHFVRAPSDLVQTLAIRPEYLKTHGHDSVINYSEWSPALGRRFRALKLWFLIRSYGLEGLRSRIRNHVTWARKLADRLRETEGFEITSEPFLSLFSFRYLGAGDLDDLNQRLVDRINDEGRVYLTQTTLDGKKVIRFQAGQFDCTEADVMAAYDAILDATQDL